jgi:hypothetical protein
MGRLFRRILVGLILFVIAVTLSVTLIVAFKDVEVVLMYVVAVGNHCYGFVQTF